MHLSPKEKMLQRIEKKGIQIKKSFNQSVIGLDYGGGVSFTSRVSVGEDQKNKVKPLYLLILPQFTDLGDAEQAIDLAWGLANYELLHKKSSKRNGLLELFNPNASYFRHKRLWEEAELICINEGFMYPSTKRRLQGLKDLLKPNDNFERETNFSEEKRIFRRLFDRRRELFLHNAINSLWVSVKKYFGYFRFFIKTYFSCLFLLLFLALLDKADLTISIFEGIGLMTGSQIVKHASMIHLTSMLFWLCFHYMRKIR